MKRTYSFRTTLTLSFVVALVAFAYPWMMAASAGLMSSLKVSAALALLWAATVVTALVVFKKRGLWLFTGAPASLYWSVVLVWIYWNCDRGWKGFCG